MKPHPLSPSGTAAANPVASEDSLRSLPAESGPVDFSEYEDAFGEKPAETLDLNTWVVGEDLPALYARL